MSPLLNDKFNKLFKFAFVIINKTPVSERNTPIIWNEFVFSILSKDENNIIIIEDAAESHGQEVEGKICGSIGDVSTFSFYANKHITTGEGGAVLTDNKEHFLRLKQMVNLDFESSKRFIHNNLYWNYRLGGLQACLLYTSPSPRD
mgnify:CR=1 FL=1